MAKIVAPVDTGWTCDMFDLTSSSNYTTTTHHSTNTTNSYNYNSKTQKLIEGIS